MRPPAVMLLLAVALAACRTTPAASPTARRYIVTAAPLDVATVSRDLCVGVNAADAHGVWWWEPGSSGCSSRSTGPGVFHAENAAVAANGGPGAIDVRFRVRLKRAPDSTTPDFADVGLVIHDGRMRDTTSGATVATERRANLELPEQPPNR